MGEKWRRYRRGTCTVSCNDMWYYVKFSATRSTQSPESLGNRRRRLGASHRRLAKGYSRGLAPGVVPLSSAGELDKAAQHLGARLSDIVHRLGVSVSSLCRWRNNSRYFHTTLPFMNSSGAKTSIASTGLDLPRSQSAAPRVTCRPKPWYTSKRGALPPPPFLSGSPRRST